MLEGLKGLRTEDSLTEEERTAISKDGRDRYLDGGEFYDGSFYRDNEGYILKEHPQQTRLVAEWVAQRNGEI